MAQSPLFALIIEDDFDAAAIFEAALQAAGFETEIIHDGAEAITRLKETKPAIVALDLHLPHVSGAEILHKIRSDERLTKTRVMLVTADPAMADTLQPEADLVLIKPVSYSQLRDLAKRLRPTDTIHLE